MSHALDFHVWPLVGIGTSIVACSLLVVAVVAAFAFIPALRRRSVLTRGVPLALLATLVVLAAAHVTQLNVRQAPADEATHKANQAVPQSPLFGRWRPSGKLPETGALSTVDIPGTESGMKMRPAKLYLPPAYFATPRPDLPVLILMPGLPGAPEDWLKLGRVAETMDAFAAAHDGLAPVVLIVDATGSQQGNLLCVDSPLGRADTYLSRDVPAWISSHLQVTDDHRRWVIGGLSLGGTCSLQLATAHPDVYGVFMDLSGQREPTLGKHADTVKKVYRGDEAAYQAASPINRLRTRRYPELAGMFLVGDGDKEFRPGVEKLYEAAKAAGVATQLTLVPGKHDWGVWSTGLKTVTPWLAKTTGITG